MYSLKDFSSCIASADHNLELIGIAAKHQEISPFPDSDIAYYLKMENYLRRTKSAIDQAIKFHQATNPENDQ